MDCNSNESVATAVPESDVCRKLAGRWSGGRFDPIDIRLGRCTTDNDDEYPATAPINADRICAGDLSDLYYGRWCIGKSYKVSRQTTVVVGQHGRSGRAVRKELYDHLNRTAVTCLPDGPCNTPLTQVWGRDTGPGPCPQEKPSSLLASGNCYSRWSM